MLGESAQMDWGADLREVSIVRGTSAGLAVDMPTEDRGIESRSSGRTGLSALVTPEASLYTGVAARSLAGLGSAIADERRVATYAATPPTTTSMATARQEVVVLRDSSEGSRSGGAADAFACLA